MGFNSASFLRSLTTPPEKQNEALYGPAPTVYRGAVSAKSNGTLLPVAPSNGACGQVDSINIQFVNFEGTQIDELVTLASPADSLYFTMCGGGAGPTMVLAGWIHFKPLNLTPATLTAGLPIGVEGLPISHFQRAFQFGDNNFNIETARNVPRHPMVKFCKPVSKFYLTMWGLDTAGAITTDPSLTIIATSDIDEFISYPTPKKLAGTGPAGDTITFDGA